MAARETHIAITNVLRTLQDCRLLYSYQNPIRSDANDLEMVTWPNHQRGAVHNFPDSFGMHDQYRCILEQNSYLAILWDGSLIRASYAFRRNRLVGHSLWYWPYPLDVPREDIEQETPLDALDLYEASWRERARYRTPMRFDYAPDAAGEDHPASHLHFQVDDCRLAVERPVSFGSFVRFIFRNFYAANWRANADIWADLAEELPEEECACITVGEKRSPYIGWTMNVPVAGN